MKVCNSFQMQQDTLKKKKKSTILTLEVENYRVEFLNIFMVNEPLEFSWIKKNEHTG